MLPLLPQRMCALPALACASCIFSRTPIALDTGLGAWWHAFERPVNKADPTCAAPSKATGQALQARAAEATASDLEAKVGACKSLIEAIQKRLELLRGLEEPPPQSSVSKVEEELRTTNEEHARLSGRAAKARVHAEGLATQAAAAESAEQQAAEETPLPCPVCRAPISTFAMDAAGVCRQASKAHADSKALPLKLTEVQKREQDERRRLLHSRMQRQREPEQGSTSDAESSLPSPHPRLAASPPTLRGDFCDGRSACATGVKRGEHGRGGHQVHGAGRTSSQLEAGHEGSNAGKGRGGHRRRGKGKGAGM